MPLLVRTLALALAAVLLSGIGASAQERVKQIKLTEKQVEAIIAVQGDQDFAASVKKLLGKPATDAAIVAELDVAARKHGLKDYAEYVDVFNTIGLVMNRIDPQTKAMIDTEAEIKKEIAEVTADKSIADEDRKLLLRDLDQSLMSLQPIEHPGNLALVLKYYDKLKDAL